MKKETLIMMVVFLGAGFLGGYVYNAHRNSQLRQPAATATLAASTPGQTAGNSMATDSAIRLPKGHPPVSAAEVVQFFKDAADRNPNDPQPRLQLGNFYYDRQQWSSAIPWYLKSLRLNTKNVDARTDLATCYFEVGEPGQALKQLHEALKIDPRHQATLFNLIVINLEGTHDLSAAKQAWKQLDEIDPAYPHLAELKQMLDQHLTSGK